MGAKKKENYTAFQPEDVQNYIDTYWRYYSSLEDDYCTIMQEMSNDNKSSNALISRVKLYLAIGSEIDVLLKVICQTIDTLYNGDNITLHRNQLLQMVNNGDWDSLDQEVTIIERYETLKPWEYFADTNTSIIWWKSYNNVKHKRTCVDPIGQLYFQQSTVENILHSLGALYILEKQYLEYMMAYLIQATDIEFSTCESILFRI